MFRPPSTRFTNRDPVRSPSGVVILIAKRPLGYQVEGVARVVAVEDDLAAGEAATTGKL